MDIDEKLEHMAKAWNEYNERFHSFWMKALSIKNFRLWLAYNLSLWALKISPGTDEIRK